MGKKYTQKEGTCNSDRCSSKPSVRQPGKETFYWVSRRHRPATPPHCLILRARVISVGGWACLASVRLGFDFTVGWGWRERTCRPLIFFWHKPITILQLGNADDYTWPWLERIPRQNFYWKSKWWGLERRLSHEVTRLLFRGTRVLLLAPKWQLLLTQAPGSYYTFFRLPWHSMHVVYRHICRQNTHTHKSIFYFKNLNRKICFITWIQQCHLVSFIQIWKQTQSHDFLSEEQAVPRDVNNMTGWELYQRELWNYFIKARPLLKKH